MNGTGVAGVAIGMAGEVCVLGIHANRLGDRHGLWKSRFGMYVTLEICTTSAMVLCKIIGLGWVAARGCMAVYQLGPGHDWILTLQAAMCAIAALMNLNICKPWLLDAFADACTMIELWSAQCSKKPEP
eukprot:TRINITY_DN8375_c0_g1_i3.p2 TRINITY_DN8375_c0_g1~~TRINITY_DN8375_c0_g1_i3.p2  ORF type:complete len:129 (-),score=12.68 TRINITY_DN8375_c0_g1_i3:429-815(-)